MTHTPIGSVDWAALAEQKTTLLTLIWDDPEHMLYGLVHFIDAFQDKYEPEANR